MFSRCSVAMWILTLSSIVFFITVSGSTTEDEFEYTYPYPEVGLPPVHDIIDPDEWPDGSYALLMSKHGCPRGRWNRGYISFTWRTPHVVLSHEHTNHCDNYNVTTEDKNVHCRKLLSQKTWPTSESNLFGPFSEFKMTLNFCQRIQDTEADTQDKTSAWPQAYFSLFGTNSGCPQGFHDEYRPLILPSVDTWTDNGFLPYFTIDTDQNERTIVTLRECVRDVPTDISATHYLSTNQSYFILLKHEDYPCPDIEDYFVRRPETISIADLHSSTPNTSRLFQFCFYQPLGSIPSGLMKMTTTVHVLQPGTEESNELPDNGYTMFCSEDTTCWALIDMGRSLLIEKVFLEFNYPNIKPHTILAGNDKWQLLRYGGVEILRSEKTSHFVGRYIAIITHYKIGQKYKCNVLAQRTNTMCMVDLGMADSSITTDQISSSDQNSMNLDLARAYNSGWCTNSKDPDPYIQVDLLAETLVDGITVHNWYNTEIDITTGSYTKMFIPMGTRSFSVLYSTDDHLFDAYNNMSFYIEQFRPSDEPQTFIFYRQIIARYLRIVLLEPMTRGRLCIRFELHGCRHYGALDGPPLWFNTDKIIGRQTIKSLSQFTSIGYPLSYRDGTSYGWIINFRKVGFIKLIFKQISLQNYQDKTFAHYWYSCVDVFSITFDTDKWSLPTPTDLQNLIIETNEKYLLMEFKSCLPFTPRNKVGKYFNVLVEKAEPPSCTNLTIDDFWESADRTQYCYLPTMILSTRSLLNIPIKKFQELWNITIPKFSIRLTVKDFHISCQSDTVLEVHDQFSPTVSYTNCKQPPSTLLSESETVSLVFKIGPRSLRPNNYLMKAGFRAEYSPVEMHHQQLLDTEGHNFYGFQKIEDNDGQSDNAKNSASILIYKACSITFMKCYDIYTGEPVTWQDADDTCWVRGMEMVSIRSREELFVVKYMLRTFKNVKVDDHTIDRVFPTNVVDPNYYSHIGISRLLNADGNSQFVWQDRSPVLFSAWNKYQPGLEGNCVRMSFHLANRNNTWEVEDCYKHLARYFICEKPVENLPLQDLESKNPKTYTGKMNRTKNGRFCQRWDSVTPHYHNDTDPDMFPEGNVTAAENFCRDPSNSGYLWCYTLDSERPWEKCPVIKLEEWTPSAYTGRLSTTLSGHTCQRWDTQTPHRHSQNKSEYFPDNTVSDAANYCRDPMEEAGTLWCYTTNPDIRWDVCKLTDTASDRCHTTHYRYNGTWNVTSSGLTCQRWDSPKPHKVDPPDRFFPEGNKSKAENYCRDPSDFGVNWCYTTDPDVEWEFCFVQDYKPFTTDTPASQKYTCTDGNQISSQKICNGIVDCVDAQDELNCDYQVQNLLKRGPVTNEMGERIDTKFICGSKEIISFLAECDGVIDCIDGTDEKNCMRDSAQCSKHEFQCGDGSCIHTSLMCDFIPHCTDFSDEHCDYSDCKSTEVFKCKNGQCILHEQKCNAHKDCLDGSDEEKCDSCSSEAFHCDVMRCIHNRHVCDGIPDCSDGKDEKKCLDAIYQTCKDRWMNGFRRNGIYLLDDTIAECNFDNVQKDGIVSTIFYASTKCWEYELGNIYEEHNRCIIELIDTTQSKMNRFLTDHAYDCDQTFIQRCTFAVRTVAAIEDINYENDYQHCRCVALTVIPYKPETASVHACDNKTHTLDESLMYISYNASITYGAFLVRKEPFNNDIEIKVGPITCKNELINNASTLPCDEDGLMYPASSRCIYDTDNAGYILGCRSGSHLQHCFNFECPDGMFKCPGSYCVHLHHICDGTDQCPDRADEHGCGCNNDDLELIMLIHKDAFVDNDQKLRQIAVQFNNPGTTVRIVHFHTRIIDDFFQMLVLEDIDVSTKTAFKRERECYYGILASDYIDSVRFTTNATSRGIIFLQNGTETENDSQYIFQNMSKPDFDVYRVVKRSLINFEREEDNEYKYVTDITVNSFDILSSIGTKLFPSLCKDSVTTLCQDNYKCSSSKLCIALDKVCDGHVHCPFSDDEMFCDFVCPSICSCSGYDLDCTSANFDESSDFSNDLDIRIRALDLSTNIRVGEYLSSVENFYYFPYMIRLNLSECNIRRLGSKYFTKVPNLRSLDLGRNKISIIPRQVFYGLKKLVYLNLNGNVGYMTYESFAFAGLVSLRYLMIMDADIASISSKTFSGLSLDTLQVCHNRIRNFRDDAFSSLTVNKIILESNDITTFDRGLFDGILNLTLLKTSAYKYCCIRPDYLPESACLPERDEFSSCDDLMRNSALQTMLWLMGICALLGNILAIVYRIVYDRQRLKLGFGMFVTNLAVADLFMGMYLLIIASADASFRKRYIFMDEYWRNSVWCTFAGVLSTLSSEASVLFLSLITLDRFIVIKYPYSRLRFTPERASVAALVAWILSLSISVIPLIAKDHFQNEFYAKSGVCVALPLTRDRPPGWLYSVIVFVGVNFATFIGIAFGQLLIYLEIKNVSSKVKKNRGGKSKANRRKELIIARNLLLVVATDFLCWFPIGCMCMMAMTGYVIPGEVYAWVAVFVLPVNSALNPVLYTLTAILGNRKQQDAIVSSSTGPHSFRNKHFMKKLDNKKLLSFFGYKTEKCCSAMISVESIIQQKKELTPAILLKFTTQLTRCLRLLHKNSMALESLDARSVFVTMEYGKITGDIQIRQQPQQRASFESKTDNLYQLGAIVGRLMEYNMKQV